MCDGSWREGTDADELVFLASTGSLIYRNSFFPEAAMRFEEHDGQVNIRVCCRLQRASKVIWIVLMFAAAAMFVAFVLASIRTGGHLGSAAFFPLG